VSFRLRGASDRRLTLLAITIAAGYLALAILSVITPAASVHGTWLPLHLLLAGAASTAIAGVMPFFSAAVSSAPPAANGVRLAGVLGVALGAGLLVLGRAFWPVGIGVDGPAVAGAGGLVYIFGLAAIAAATLLPLRFAIGPRRIFMGAIYGVALLNVAAGVALSTGFLLGWAPVVGAWGALKPAHAWLNLFGFVSLVIAGSLLHLLPTVAGARIRRTMASVVCFAAMASGPPLVAAGFVVGSDILALAGAGLTVVGSLALAWHAVAVLRGRSAWSSDPSWHRFTTWSLVAGIGWFVVASLVAGGQIVLEGSTVAGWDLAPLAVPLGIGWAAQVLVGAWSHLVPAVGPGSPDQHARQRRLLGQAATARLLLLNGGVVFLMLATALDVEPLAVAGLATIVAAGVLAVALLVAALAVLFNAQWKGSGP
jgi:nitrite reductase (NO-forming)